MFKKILKKQYCGELLCFRDRVCNIAKSLWKYWLRTHNFTYHILHAFLEQLFVKHVTPLYSLIFYSILDKSWLQILSNQWLTIHGKFEANWPKCRLILMFDFFGTLKRKFTLCGFPNEIITKIRYFELHKVKLKW